MGIMGFTKGCAYGALRGLTWECWVSFSIPVMVMGFSKVVLGIFFDTHDGHRKLFGSFGSVWGNLRALGIVFDTRE